jgi:hypothetical protein
MFNLFGEIRSYQRASALFEDLIELMFDGGTVHCIAMLTQPGITGSAHIRMLVRHRLLGLVLVVRRSLDQEALFCVFDLYVFWSTSSDRGQTSEVSQYPNHRLVKFPFFLVSAVCCPVKGRSSELNQ